MSSIYNIFGDTAIRGNFYNQDYKTTLFGTRQAHAYFERDVDISGNLQVGSIADVEQYAIDLSGSLATTNSNLNTLSSTVSGHTATLAAIATLDATQTSRLNTLDSSMNSVSSTVSGHTATLASIASLDTTQNTRLNTLDASMNSLNSSVTAINTVNATQTTDISALQTKTTRMSYASNETTFNYGVNISPIGINLSDISGNLPTPKYGF